MPFLSPLWARGPRITFLHHVHGEMWKMVLPPRLAAMGDLLERRIAPPLYRRSRIVTLSESSRDDMLAQLRPVPARVDVVPPGIDHRFSPGDESPTPLVVAVGRLVPSKHVDRLVRAGAHAPLGSADCRGRGGQSGWILGGAATYKKKNTTRKKIKT